MATKKTTEPNGEKACYMAAAHEANRHGMQHVACALARLAGEQWSPAESYKSGKRAVQETETEDAA